MEPGTMTTLAEIDDLLSGPDLVTAADLADWLGLTPNRVHALGRDGVLPRAADKTYPLRASVRAYADHCRQLAKGKATDAELAAEKLRLAREQADKVSIQNAKARGELIATVDVSRAWGEVATDLRAAVLAISSRVAGQVGLDRETTAALDAEIRATLAAIADGEHRDD